MQRVFLSLLAFVIVICFTTDRGFCSPNSDRELTEAFWHDATSRLMGKRWSPSYLKRLGGEARVEVWRVRHYRHWCAAVIVIQNDTLVSAVPIVGHVRGALLYYVIGDAQSSGPAGRDETIGHVLSRETLSPILGNDCIPVDTILFDLAFDDIYQNGPFAESYFAIGIDSILTKHRISITEAEPDTSLAAKGDAYLLRLALEQDRETVIAIDDEIQLSQGKVFIVRMLFEEQEVYTFWATTRTESEFVTWSFGGVFWGKVSRGYHRLLVADSLPILVDSGEWWNSPEMWTIIEGDRTSETTHRIPLSASRRAD